MPDLTAGARHQRVIPAPAGHSPLEHVNDLLRYYAEGCSVDVLVQGVDPDEWALVTAPASKAGCKRLVLSDEPEVTVSLFPRRP